MADPVGGFLPLKPAWFHILLALAEEHGHGYAIRQAVKARTEGRLELWPATLYGSIAELEDAGLIEEWQPRKLQDDMTRRFYRLTPIGRRVLAAEADRMDALVRMVRASAGGKRTP
jgi:DNA-binding PadR family transcriptional regulator